MQLVYLSTDELNRSLVQNWVERQGQSDGSDPFFLAMAHHRLGYRDDARE